MIVQACINGARRGDFHAALPLTAEAMARDAEACVAAGAAELHIHPRGPDGRRTQSIEEQGVSNDEVVHGSILAPRWISST